MIVALSDDDGPSVARILTLRDRLICRRFRSRRVRSIGPSSSSARRYRPRRSRSARNRARRNPRCRWMVNILSRVHMRRLAAPGAALIVVDGVDVVEARDQRAGHQRFASCRPRRSTSPRWSSRGFPCSRWRRRRGSASCCRGEDRRRRVGWLARRMTPAGVDRRPRAAVVCGRTFALADEQEDDRADDGKQHDAGGDYRLSVPRFEGARSHRVGR